MLTSSTLTFYMEVWPTETIAHSMQCIKIMRIQWRVRCCNPHELHFHIQERVTWRRVACWFKATVGDPCLCIAIYSILCAKYEWGLWLSKVLAEEHIIPPPLTEKSQSDEWYFQAHTEWDIQNTALKSASNLTLMEIKGRLLCLAISYLTAYHTQVLGQAHVSQEAAT